MQDNRRPTVQMLDDAAWERGEISIIGRPVPLDEWLGKLREWEMQLSVPPLSRITGGPYDGGHVLMATGETRLYFAVPAIVLPLLRNWLTEREYNGLLRRIGR